jgi:isoquinoline 1-oxidoreductase subunit alpha
MCGIAQCGVCTVHAGGEAVRSCQTPVGSIEKKAVTTSPSGVGRLVGLG